MKQPWRVQVFLPLEGPTFLWAVAPWSTVCRKHGMAGGPVPHLQAWMQNTGGPGYLQDGDGRALNQVPTFRAQGPVMHRARTSEVGPSLPRSLHGGKTDVTASQEAFSERRLSDWPSGCPSQISTRLEPLAALLIIWLDSTSTW